MLFRSILNYWTKTATITALFVGMTFAPLPNQKASAQTSPLGLYVCNESGENLNVTVAYYNGYIWTTQGRYQLSQTPGSCIQVYNNSLNNTRYYLYATSDSGNQWQGNHPFCIGSTPNFTIPYADETQYCGSFVKNFFSIWVPNPVTGITPTFYGYTFAPNNYSNNWNSPRAER
ncbi:MAG: DUF1036 domain-containing protein [Nostoc sp. NMS7]|uniref:DUF1036 domain-containing protein n=1 Tax=Nostoc sp. NMS7 TaxID=2815391 RepID=UPI0025DFFD2A|nr:DUF1036 domain-containing protein [Nostoc sp. NMS7]MBN3952022.1 DUF1036 domain-containing protein [Nostoc sp. NMS7]